MEVYDQQHDLEAVGGLLGHKSIETMQLYAQIRPPRLKHAVQFYEAKALDALSSDTTQTRGPQTSTKTTWWPQGDTNPFVL